MLLLLSLAACASYEPAALSPARNAHSLDTRSLNTPHLEKFIAAELGDTTDKPDPPARWDLARLTLVALYYHPDIAIARSKLTAAEAAVITAGQRPNPGSSLTNVFGTAVTAGAIPAGV
ncbi:MAG TPA: hypothetical protein VE993_19000, partial [Stellaceae bacterium]|nr:hypothetical protein [Stellaceae bacterium]